MCTNLMKLHFSHISLFSGTALALLLFCIVTTYIHCYSPWYKLVIQSGVSLCSIHNLGPAVLGSVYPCRPPASCITDTYICISICVYVCDVCVCVFVCLRGKPYSNKMQGIYIDQVQCNFLPPDINECIDSSPCDENATCSNTDGTFICACNVGFTGSGINCTGEMVICTQHY